MVEFAFSAPLLFLMLLALIEFGNGLNAYLTVLAASRDAARLGAKFGTADLTPLQTLITNETARLASAPIPTTPNCPGGNTEGVCITWGTRPPIGNQSDKWLDVRICYDHPLIVGFPPLVTGPIKLCAHTEMRVIQ